MNLPDRDRNLKIQPVQLQEICQQWQIVELALFGSVLRDDFDSKSDVDIWVSFATGAKVSFFDLEAIEEQLSRI